MDNTIHNHLVLAHRNQGFYGFFDSLRNLSNTGISVHIGRCSDYFIFCVNNRICYVFVFMLYTELVDLFSCSSIVSNCDSTFLEC